EGDFVPISSSVRTKAQWRHQLNFSLRHRFFYYYN
ncbi:MAG: hypothetical protein ACJA13_001892, partial [Paraglaciecola sp.]